MDSNDKEKSQTSRNSWSLLNPQGAKKWHTVKITCSHKYKERRRGVTEEQREQSKQNIWRLQIRTKELQCTTQETTMQGTNTRKLIGPFLVQRAMITDGNRIFNTQTTHMHCLNVTSISSRKCRRKNSWTDQVEDLWCCLLMVFGVTSDLLVPFHKGSWNETNYCFHGALLVK